MASHAKTCQVDFKGVLKRDVCATLSVEFINYILHERGLIPAPYNQLQHALVASSGNRAEEKENGSICSACPVSAKSRRAVQSMNDLEQLHRHLRSAFVGSLLPIDRLVVVVGPSLMAPLETYELCFPTDRCSDVEASEQQAKHELFKKLFVCDFIESFSSKPPGLQCALSVLLEAPRNAGIDWFQPFPVFRMPTRGKLFRIIMDNQCSDASSDSSLDASSWSNISGIGPLDSSSSCEDGEELPASEGSPLASCSKGAPSGSNTEEVLDLQEKVWYRSPTQLKGFAEF